MKLPLAALSLACLATLAACDGSSPPAASPDAAPPDAPAEAAAPDQPAAPDAPAPDLPPPMDVAKDVAPDAPDDVAMDATMDVAPDAPAGCRSAADCASDPGGRACDTATGRCVACLPGMRGQCAASEYCTAAMRCESGCGDDADCAGDGGLTRCDPVRHACARCVTDDHCPAGEVCRLGSCAPGCTDAHACPVGRSCCEGTCYDLAADPARCGACGTSCPGGDNATAACAVGRCGLTCAAGFADCDGMAANGCEAPLSDATSCGRCGNACPASAPLCARGTDGSLACATGCATAQLRCGADCVDPLADARHCGACGAACPDGAHASPACQMGRCGLACEPGYADCNGSAADGCEVDTRVTVANCGACGTACTAGPNATASCGAGRCAFTCAAGFADCDGNAANGCEVDTRSSPANCGACGRACPDGANAAASCAAGACGLTCAAGFADCNANAADGCEAALGDASSCGRCGNVCSAATPVCSAAMGACVTGCATGQVRCGAACTDIQTAVDHCGGCGMACPEPARAARTCAAGRCGFTCEANYADCDGMAANGCEANLQTSAQHCGACGRACAPGLDCRSGACTPVYTSCRAILDAGLSMGDGVYTILLGGTPTSVRCLMSADGGGWTLAGNFPYPGGTSGVAGWTSGARVGTSFTDLSRPFKLSDAEINALRTTGFRARGTATRCVQGACSVDTTLYWRPTCAYASGSNSPACYTAFRDAAFTVSESTTAPCGWHWGLVASDCSTTATMGTSHTGEHVFVGNYRSYVHAYDGRAGEDPTVQFWVR